MTFDKRSFLIFTPKQKIFWMKFELKNLFLDV